MWIVWIEGVEGRLARARTEAIIIMVALFVPLDLSVALILGLPKCFVSDRPYHSSAYAFRKIK